MWPFVAGLFAGAFAGFLVTAFLAAAADEDAALERAVEAWKKEMNL